ncbi:hypothetical protein A8C56_02620 [Niabella ginsenosidivorans]|uniref:Peptide O-xylosyltransferase n=1 Tax=Niabella ginsenosidivorans TaxID=1176587 RepID=A0A1A9HYZ6_9BACT|nr:beta-1,6-N-acetylglucosaminyltransferase [Niabella ginsenosidivorans]ANH80019.1 hypothetical protein A8C56_02620 [Niabella ginsenosidivorans]
MKLAHLILVHSNPVQTEKLIKRLYHPDADIYIHLDAKAPIDEFQYLTENQVTFIRTRVSIKWGDYSMVKATLRSFEEILASGVEYSHINLLSGQDYPLKSAQEIQKFLFANQGKTFMRSLAIPEEWDEPVGRLEKYNLGDLKFPGKYIVQDIINKILPKRKLPNHLKAYGRSQWFTITPECALYTIKYLKENSNVRRFFKRTWAADELIFQTILFNSELKHTIVNDHLRYIKFRKGDSRPKTLTVEDKNALLSSGKFYARKFDILKDSAILYLLDKIIDAEILINNCV